jgi:hypothetical protein
MADTRYEQQQSADAENDRELTELEGTPYWEVTFGDGFSRALLGRFRTEEAAQAECNYEEKIGARYGFTNFSILWRRNSAQDKA